MSLTRVDPILNREAIDSKSEDCLPKSLPSSYLPESQSYKAKRKNKKATKKNSEESDKPDKACIKETVNSDPDGQSNQDPQDSNDKSIEVL